MPIASDSDGHRREAGALHEHANCEANVLREGLEAPEGPQVAALLLQGHGIAEPAHGREARFVRALARRRVLLFAHGEMEAQLVVQVALEPAAPEERPDPLPDASASLPGGHGLRPSP